MHTSFVTSTVVVALVLLLQPLAFAQENRVKRYISGFAVIGDDYPEAHIPMTALERELFINITDLLIDAGRREPDTQGYLANVRGTSLLSVKINKKGNILVNLDKNILPKYWDAAIEDFSSLLGHEVRDVAEEKMQEVGSVLFVFDGKDPSAYDPTMSLPPRKKDKPHSNLDPLAIPGTVVVSAGHGIYYHYGFRDWRAQRDPSNGIIRRLSHAQACQHTGNLVTEPQPGNDVSGKRSA